MRAISFPIPVLAALLSAFLGSCLVIPMRAGAQRVTVSEAISLRKDDFYQILGRVGGRVLISTDNGYSLELLSFDERLRMTGKKELELDKRRLQILGVVPSGDQFAVLYMVGRRGETFLKAHRYNADGVLQDSATIYQFQDNMQAPDCRLVASEDESKVLIYYTEKQAWLSVGVLDLRSLKVLWWTRVAIDAFSFYKDFRSILLDNQGSMHLILEKESRRSRPEEHHLELVQFGVGFESAMSRHIGLEGLKPQRFRFAYDNRNRRLVGAGLTAEKSPNRANGLFCFFIDEKVEGVFDLVGHPFSEEIARKMTGNPDALQKGLEDLEIKEMLLREDGGIVLFVEESRRLERNIAGQQFHFGPAGARFIVDYYYEDLLVSSFGPQGSLDWQEVLPKKQYSQDDDGLFSSAFIMIAPDVLRLIYNDEIAYENTVSAYQLNHTGKAERMSVLNTDYQKLKLIFREARQTGVYELLVPSERSGKVRLVRMEF